MTIAKTAAAAVLVVVLAAVALGEWAGWPFLAAPLERMLSDTLDHRVQLGAGSAPDAASSTPFRVRFIGGLRLSAAQLEIAAPAWSTGPPLLRAHDVAIELRYIDLWRAHRGQPLRIRSLHAGSIEVDAQRLADGRASWQFGPAAVPGAPVAPSRSLPSFGQLRVDSGRLRLHDVPLALDIEAEMSLSDEPAPASRFRLHAQGQFRQQPLKIELVSAGVLPWVADEAPAVPVAVDLQATIGRASLAFKGSAADALHLNGLSGRFSLSGPSLAAVGDPLGVTLPTTAAFRSAGAVAKQGDKWHVVIDDATVGASRLRGDFNFDSGRSVPMLSGRLLGQRLLLVDLGPVVGTTPLVAPLAPPIAASAPKPAARRDSPGKVLPDRPFDLAALRVMDADVQIDIAEVDLNTRWLQPLRPLRTHLQLAGGVLSLREIDARTAQGRLVGDVRLDGRPAVALWQAALRWDGVRLEHWIRPARGAGPQPMVSGRLDGRADLKGQGRSTAEILAKLQGEVRTELHEGAVSHLIVEAAGLDLAEALSLLIKGDDVLPVSCAVADLVAQAGVLRPRVMVIDTSDSTLWVDGSLSLASEAMDLRVAVSPKDFSPLTLRTPLRVRGSFDQPVVSLDKTPIARKVATALLLALVNPLAALIPLIDTGDANAASRGTQGCHNLQQRAARPAPARR